MKVKSALFLLPFFAAASVSAFEGGHCSAGDTFALAELPLGGTLVEPDQPGRLHFYLPQAHEIYDAGEGKTTCSGGKRARRFASSSLFYSKDGKSWKLGGDGLHFTAVWSHPGSTSYFAAIAGISYLSKRGQLVKNILYRIAVSEDGKLWKSIQGDLEPCETEPRFFVDPEHPKRVCLFFPGRDVRGARWAVAQSQDGDYAKWKLFHSQAWKHDIPGGRAR